MVKLRLTGLGKKKCPVYRIAAMEALGKRDGKAIAFVGSYNPLVNPAAVVLDEEAVIKFLMNGAQPTRTVKAIITNAGVWQKFEDAKKTK